jgi:hypothetical protein
VACHRAGGPKCPPAPTSPRRIPSVVPFVCAPVPGTTRGHAHATRTALPGLRPAEAGSYWEHSHQSWRLNHRGTSPPAPGTTPAALAPCAVSHALHPCGHVGRTPQRPHPTGYVRDSRPGIVSRPSLGADFGDQNTEAVTYPSPSDVAGSAPSPPGLTGKGLTPLSSLSFSRSAFSQRNPGGKSPPASPCHHGKAPDASGVGRTSRALHPNGPAGLWSAPPPAGFEVSLAPALSLTTSRIRTGKRFPLALTPWVIS